MSERFVQLSNLSPELNAEMLKFSAVKEIPLGTVILREGQYVKVIPVVIDGLIKIFSIFEDKEILLYYIQPNESCIMSFAASLRDEPGKIYAEAEEDTKAILILSD